MIVLALDTLSQADGALNSNFTQQSGFAMPNVASHIMRPSAVGGSGSGAYYNARTFPNDQISWVQVNNMFNANNGVLASVRCDGSGNCYAVQAKGPTGASAVAQIKKIGTGGGVLVANATFTVNATDWLGLQVVGNVLTSYLLTAAGVLSQLQTYTDSSSPFTSGQPGVSLFAAAGAVTDAGISAWMGAIPGSGLLVPVNAGLDPRIF